MMKESPSATTPRNALLWSSYLRQTDMNTCIMYIYACISCAGEGSEHCISVQYLSAAHEHAHACEGFAHAGAENGFDESNIEY